MSVIDDYLARATTEQRAELNRLRALVRGIVPAEAVEVLSYGMPTFDYRGKHVIHFAAFKKHMSIFPGTIRFTAERPVPDEVVTGIVLKRLAQIEAETAQA